MTGGTSIRPLLRVGLTGGRVLEALSRPVRTNGRRAWTPAMTVLALSALVLTALAAPFDAAAIRAVRADDSALRAWLVAVTHVGQSQWYLVPAGLTVIGLAALDWPRRGRLVTARMSLVFGQAAFAFAAIAASGILVNIFKLFVGRSRPRLLDAGGPFQFEPFSMSSVFQSFPSGHSTVCGALAMILILWLPRLWPLFGALGIGFAFTRVAALAHYPSDVIAGLAFGALCTLFLARWLALRGLAFRLDGDESLPVPRHRRAWRARRRPESGMENLSNDRRARASIRT